MLAGLMAWLLTVGVLAADAWACDGTGCSELGGMGTRAGARVRTLARDELRRFEREADQAAMPQAKPPFFRFTSTANCVNSTPSSPVNDASCATMNAPCENNTPTQGQGPAVKVYRSRVDGDAKPVDARGRVAAAASWEYLGVTCLPDLVPGRSRPLTMAQIRAAFHDTRFAVASLHLQPEGDVTLVHLPTYLELRWPVEGYQPGEVDAVDPGRMSGYRVDIRPQLTSVVYRFGDGTVSPATTSLGGSYPDGDVIHSYDAAGRYELRADVTYQGQYRVAGGAWVDIPDSVTILGTRQVLTVRTAHARLYGNGG